MYNNNIIQGFHIKYNMTEIDKDVSSVNTGHFNYCLFKYFNH